MSNATANEHAAFQLALERGDTIDRSEFLIKFGKNPDIDTGTLPEDVWSQGGLYNWPAVAQTMSVVSSSIADDVGSTGVTSVRIYGLDADFLEVTDDIIMDGQTPVVGSVEFLRVFRMEALTAGTGLTNAGTITATGTTSSLVHGAIPAGTGQSQMAIYTVPAGKRLVMSYFDVSITRDAAGGASAQANIELYIRDASTSGAPWKVKYEKNLQITGTGSFASAPKVARYVFPAKTDIRIEVDTVTDSNTGIEATFAGLLVEVV